MNLRLMAFFLAVLAIVLVAVLQTESFNTSAGNETVATVALAATTGGEETILTLSQPVSKSLFEDATLTGQTSLSLTSGTGLSPPADISRGLLVSDDLASLNTVTTLETALSPPTTLVERGVGFENGIYSGSSATVDQTALSPPRLAGQSFDIDIADNSAWTSAAEPSVTWSQVNVTTAGAEVLDAAFAPVRNLLSDNWIIAVVLLVFLALAPPGLTSFGTHTVETTRWKPLKVEFVITRHDIMKLGRVALNQLQGMARGFTLALTPRRFSASLACVNESGV